MPIGIPTLKTGGEQPSYDAFGRLRVASPVSQFSYQNQYNKGVLVWNEKAAGDGAAVHDANSSTVALSASAGAGNSIERQTREYLRYTPGKSLVVFETFQAEDLTTDSIKRIGYFDADNGAFLELNGSTPSVVIRSKSTGSVVEDSVAQSAWNVDKMDGTGPSGITVDWTKSQILVMDLQWLGVGDVRFALEIDSVLYEIHHFRHANKIEKTYMTSANLPLRYEVSGDGAGTLHQICSSVITEKVTESDNAYYTSKATTGVTQVGVTTRRPVLSIRPKATFNSIVNRAKVDIGRLELLTSTNPCYWELVYGGTLTGTPSWTSCGANSTVEQDIAATGITGGDVVDAGYSVDGAGNAVQQIQAALNSLYAMCLDIDGANPIGFSLVLTSVSGTSNNRATIAMKEFY